MVLLDVVDDNVVLLEGLVVVGLSETLKVVLATSVWTISKVERIYLILTQANGDPR